MILKISERGVRNIERRALAKLKAHPALRALWQDFQGSRALAPSGGLHEDMEGLNQGEIDALLGLARTKSEMCVIQKILSRI
jgi:hypothetical protein